MISVRQSEVLHKDYGGDKNNAAAAAANAAAAAALAACFLRCVLLLSLCGFLMVTSLNLFEVFD